MYPSGYKADKIYSLKPTDGSGDFDFARASSATRVNADGLIETVATGVPRIDYTGGGCGKLLLEPQRTNLIPYSEDFTNAEWAKSNLTVLGNQVISPDGTLSADKVSSNTSNSTHFLQEFLSTGNTVNVSVFVKNEDANYIQLTNPSSGGIFVNFDIKNGLIGSKGSQISNEKIENYGNGWYRISATFDNTGVDNRYIRFYIVSSANAPFNQSWQPSSNISFYIWGAQLEQGSYPTSYIPTSGATVTRLADTSETTGLSDVIGQTEGVLYAEIANISEDNNATVSISINDGSISNAVSLYYFSSGGVYYDVFNSAGILSGNTSMTKLQQAQKNKIALKYKSGEIALWVNGVEASTNTGTLSLSGLNQLDFDYGNGSLPFYGNVQSLMVFPSALTDDELETLTTL
jgi:hypothetical protein